MKNKILFFGIYLFGFINITQGNTLKQIVDTGDKQINIPINADTTTKIPNIAVIQEKKVRIRKANSVQKSRIEDFSNRFLNDRLKDTPHIVKNIIVTDINQNLVTKQRDNLLIDEKNIIRKPIKVNKAFVYYVGVLGVLGFLFLFLMQAHIRNIWHRVSHSSYFFANESNHPNRHIKVESHILLVFYFLNSSLFLYLIISYYKINFNFMVVSLIDIFCSIFLYQILRYVLTQTCALWLNAPWTRLQYRINVMHKELLGFVLCGSNAYLILSQSILKQRNISLLLWAFFVMYIIQKMFVFFAAQKIIKKQQFKNLSILFVSEYGVLVICLYAYAFIKN